MDEPTPALLEQFNAMVDDWMKPGGWSFLLEDPDGHDPRNYYGRLVPARPLLLRSLGIPK